MAILHGYYGEIRVGAVKFHATRWVANIRSNQVDVTNFVFNGSAAYAASLREGELTFDCIYDTLEDPFGALGLRVNAMASVTLKLDNSGVTAAQWYFPRVVFTSVRHTHMIRDVSRYTITGRVSVLNSLEIPFFPVS